MTMTGRLMLGTVLAAGLATASILAAAPAAADSNRTDCMGNNCVTVHCYDDGVCNRTTNFDERRTYYNPARYAPGLKPLRYACTEDGYSCHWTRNYFFDEDGHAIYDPGASEYPD